jgi:hypothetical protein
MNHYPDDYDLERSHELERQLDRNEEREPHSARLARPRRRQFRYWAGASFRPDRNAIATRRAA